MSFLRGRLGTAVAFRVHECSACDVPMGQDRPTSEEEGMCRSGVRVRAAVRARVSDDGHVQSV